MRQQVKLSQPIHHAPFHQTCTLGSVLRPDGFTFVMHIPEFSLIIGEYLRKKEKFVIAAKSFVIYVTEFGSAIGSDGRRGQLRRFRLINLTDVMSTVGTSFSSLVIRQRFQ